MSQATTGAAPAADRTGAMNGLLARNWWAVLLRGGVAILFGAAALFLPFATIASLILIFAAYMAADGILAIVSAVRAARGHERWGLLVFEGLADLAAAAVALIMPGAAVFAFIVLAAAWGLVSGALMLAAAFRLRKDHGRGWLVLGGVASMVWAVLLALFPIPGLVVLTWWLGAYALVFGASLLALSVTLRRRRPAAGAGAPRPA